MINLAVVDEKQLISKMNGSSGSSRQNQGNKALSELEAAPVPSSGPKGSLDRVLEALSPGDLIHTSAVAHRAGLDINVTGCILARLHRNGQVIRYFPRKSNVLNEKLWQRRFPATM